MTEGLRVFTATSPTSSGRPTDRSSASSPPRTSSSASTRSPSPICASGTSQGASASPRIRQAASLSLEHALNAKADDDSTGTAWPEVHFLGPQHPVLDWLADKLLYRVERNEAIAIPCNVEVPTVLMSGVWSNKLGEPIASAWLAATVEDGLVTFEDLFDTLEPGRRDLWHGEPARGRATSKRSKLICRP